MSVIATFSIPTADFTLGQTIRGSPGARIQLSRLIPTGDTFIPYFWAADNTVAAIERGLRAEEDIASFEVVEERDGEALIRVVWEASVNGLLEAMSETDASILEAEGADDVWRFQVRFDHHEQLSEFFQRCADKGLGIELETVHNPGGYRPSTTRRELTAAQRETLELALESGYFDVPRQTNLVELADRVGVSDSAVSQRLRRGIATVLRQDTSIRPTERVEK